MFCFKQALAIDLSKYPENTWHVLVQRTGGRIVLGKDLKFRLVVLEVIS